MTFGPFVLDVDTERLTRDGSGVHVSDHTVDVTISEIRKALGDCGRWISRHRRRCALRLATFEFGVRRLTRDARVGWGE
jgi:hypothetical protein